MTDPRATLRWLSVRWALLAAATAALFSFGISVLVDQGLLTNAVRGPWFSGLEPALRSGGCGFFYGLLAFHLQRVDPDDSHLQAGLVGAVCAFRSLATPLEGPLRAVPSCWAPLWLPLVAAALVLQACQRQWPGLQPGPSSLKR